MNEQVLQEKKKREWSKKKRTLHWDRFHERSKEDCHGTTNAGKEDELINERWYRMLVIWRKKILRHGNVNLAKKNLALFRLGV